MGTVRDKKYIVEGENEFFCKGCLTKIINSLSKISFLIMS